VKAIKPRAIAILFLIVCGLFTFGKSCSATELQSLISIAGGLQSREHLRMASQSTENSPQLQGEQTHFGRLASITTEDGVFTLSMIRWGVVRRGLLQLFSRGSRLTDFIPRYETALYEGGTSRVNSPTIASFNPLLTVLYADEEAALRGWEELAATIKKFGLVGLHVFGRRLNDPRREAWFSGVPGRTK
jgi:hypothetical protein